MNIRDVHKGTYRPDPLRGGAVGDSGKTETGAPARSENSGAAAKTMDRVELSATAQASRSETASAELDFARKALLGIPPLSEERSADILKRVQEGYYSQPERLKEIAERFTKELTGDL